MKKELAKKITLISLLIILLTLTACGGTGRNACTGEHCQYYTGTRGIMTFLDRPPQTLYYRSSDVLTGNSVELNVRLRNDGPSDSYGGVFLAGIGGSDSFLVTRIDKNGERPVLVPRTQQACYLDFFNIGDLTKPGTWSFMANCYGVSGSQYGDRRNLYVNFAQIAQIFGDNTPPWLAAIGDTGANINIGWTDGEVTQFTIGADFGLLNFGRSLMLIISGLNFEAFGGLPFYLEGDNHEFPGGGFDYKTFRIQMQGAWPAGQDHFTLPYMIRTCYAYTTFVSPMICVDPDPFSYEEKVCNDYTQSIKGSQGAPIAVTNVRTTNTGHEVIIEMTIRNVGPGKVWDVGYLEHCSPYFPGTVRPSMHNVVYVGYAHIDNRALNCGNTFKLRLDEKGEARLTCRYDLTNTAYSGSAYQSPLRMELWYGYEENIRNQLTIRRVS